MSPEDWAKLSTSKKDTLYKVALDAREARGLPREPTKEEQEQWWKADKEQALSRADGGGGVTDSTTEVVPRDPRSGSASSADPDGSVHRAAAVLGISDTNYHDLPKHLQLNADDWFNADTTRSFRETLGWVL